jgi:surface antigen
MRQAGRHAGKQICCLGAGRRIECAACSADSGPKEVDDPAAGAGLGGFLGDRIGASLDNEDKRRAYAAQTQALETGPSGAPVAWRNPDSGRYGNVVPGPAYQINGEPCREYTHAVYVDGEPQTQRGTACRNPDGSWTTMG